MKIIPSIDLLDSKRVEVISHSVDRVFEESDPIEIALSWERKGACMIHLVDIDAALNTGRNNSSIIKRVISSVKIPVQVAGGIRSRSQVKGFTSAGASRIVVRPRPCSREALSAFNGLRSIVLGLDYLGRNLLRDTGRNSLRVDEKEVASWVSELNGSIGLRGILLTDVGAEGSLKGLHGETLSFISLLKETGLELMYAGGVSSLEDVSTLMETGVDGVVVGKALYNGRLCFDDLRRVAED